jgi:hypothetical protein
MWDHTVGIGKPTSEPFTTLSAIAEQLPSNLVQLLLVFLSENPGFLPVKLLPLIIFPMVVLF